MVRSPAPPAACQSIIGVSWHLAWQPLPPVYEHVRVCECQAYWLVSRLEQLDSNASPFTIPRVTCIISSSYYMYMLCNPASQTPPFHITFGLAWPWNRQIGRIKYWQWRFLQTTKKHYITYWHFTFTLHVYLTFMTGGWITGSKTCKPVTTVGDTCFVRHSTFPVRFLVTKTGI